MPCRHSRSADAGLSVAAPGRSGRPDNPQVADTRLIETKEECPMAGILPSSDKSLTRKGNFSIGAALARSFA
jgi:hypothetical protein